MVSELYRFGQFELNVDKHKLVRGMDRVDLPPLTFQALVCLVRAAPEAVSRASIMEALWPDRVVGDETLTERIKLLRQSIEDDPARPELVLTVRGWGYRLAVTPEKARDADVVDSNKRARRPFAWRWGAAILLIVGAILWVWSNSRGPSETGAQNRLAILPLKNLSGSAEYDYLAAGISEELHNSLSLLQPDRLLVMGQVTASRLVDEPELVALYDIDYLVEGSVRLRERAVVVALRLVLASKGEQLWSGEFIPSSRDLEWQRSLISDVGIALTLDLDNMVQVPDEAVSAEAKDAYLRGRHAWLHWTKQGFETALAHFEGALEIAPDYADAHSGLADALASLAYQGAIDLESAIDRSRLHAERALALDPNSTSALATQAMLALFFDHDFDRATQLTKQALRLAPNQGDLWFAAANVSWARGCVAQGIIEAQEAVRIDPHSPILRSALALSYLFAGDDIRALEHATLALQWKPDYPYALFVGAIAMHHLGRTDEALTLLSGSTSHELVSLKGFILAKSGRRDQARELLGRPWPRRSAIAQARLLAAVGDVDAASDKLEQALMDKVPAIVTVSRYPSLRSIPRPDALATLVLKSNYDCP